MECLLTLDVGTTSLKTCVFDADLNLLGHFSEEYKLLTPDPNRVELDPETYWEASKRGIKQALEAAGVNPGQVRGIAITTQGETLIPVDRDGRVLHKALVWLDARAEEEAAVITGKVDADEFYRTTGLPEAGPACPISKVLWFKRHMPRVYEAAYKFLLLEDFLINRFTGKYVTEQALMTSTGYFDINKGVLWKEILEAFGIDPGLFPEILPCGAKAGSLKPEAARELGLKEDTCVFTAAMDQVASAVGAGNIKPGMVTETTGTALVIAATTLKPDYDNASKVTVYRHFDMDRFILLPYSPTAGIVLKWFRDSFCETETEKSRQKGVPVYRLLDEMAEGVPPLSCGLTLFPHFAGMYSPEVNTRAKGVLFGIGLDTRKEHVIRAILESIGYMLRENIELLEGMGLEISEVRSLGGGSRSRLWNSIKADILKKKLIEMESEESTSLGAAILTARALGLYPSVEAAIEKSVRTAGIYSPSPDNSAVYEKGYEFHKKLYSGLKQLFEEAV